MHRFNYQWSQSLRVKFEPKCKMCHFSSSKTRVPKYFPIVTPLFLTVQLLESPLWTPEIICQAKLSNIREGKSKLALSRSQLRPVCLPRDSAHCWPAWVLVVYFSLFSCSEWLFIEWYFTVYFTTGGISAFHCWEKQAWWKTWLWVEQSPQ